MRQSIGPRPRESSVDARENLLRTVRFERPERIPTVFHINASCWRHYPAEALQDLMEAHPVLFPGFRRPSGSVVPDFPPFARAGEPFVDPWGCVWETPESGIIGAVVKHPLESWDAFDDYEPPDPDAVTHWGPVDWHCEAETLGPAVNQSVLPNGEIGHNHTWLKLTDIRGYQNAVLDMADGEPRLLRLLDMLEQFNAGLVRNYVRYRRVEWLGFAEDLGMQRGPMLSPEHFRKYIRPSYQRLMRAARDAGAIVHVHADGDLRALMGDLLDCPIDVVNLQDLVNGIEWIAANLAGKVCIDLDIDRQAVTVRGTPQEIDALIRHEVKTLGSRQGGLMLIHGLYPGVPLVNARAVMDAMEKYSTYYS
jgi:uroporphyrinogen decarboxylase